MLVSALVRELIGGRGDIVTRPAGTAQFKGLDGRHALFRVAWSPPEASEIDAERPPALRPDSER